MPKISKLWKNYILYTVICCIRDFGKLELWQVVVRACLQHRTLEAVLDRGEKLDDLVEKSEELSLHSKAFYTTVILSVYLYLSKHFLIYPLCLPPLHVMIHLRSFSNSHVFVNYSSGYCSKSAPGMINASYCCHLTIQGRPLRWQVEANTSRKKLGE